MLKCSVLYTIEELEPYKQYWAAILEKEKNTNPFIEYEWFVTWWSILGQNDKIEIYMFTLKEEPIAFFPLLHEKVRGIHHFYFPSLQVSYYMDIITDESRKEEILKHLVAELEKQYKGFLLELDGLLESRSTCKVIEKFCIEKQYLYSIFRSVTPFIDCRKINIQQYIKATEKKFALKKRGKRLKSLCENVVFAEDDQLEKMFDLNKKRWEKKADTSAFNDDATRIFFNQIEQLKSNVFHTEIDTLQVDGGHWIGFSYSIVCRERCVSYRIGHDNDFNLFAPGQLLIKEKVIKNYNCNYEVIDMSSGYEPYKLEWATDVDYTQKLVISTSGKRERLVRFYKSAMYHLKSFMSKQRWYMQFRRNTIGEIRYFIRKATQKEKITLINQLARNYIKKQKITIYSLENTMDERKRNARYVELHLKDIIGKKDRSTLIPMLYRGFRLFSRDGKKVNFCRHDQFIREESINYMEALPSNSTFIKDYDVNNLQEIVDMIQHEGLTIYTAVHGVSHKKRSILKKLGFQKVERISKFRILKWEKVMKKAY